MIPLQICSLSGINVCGRRDWTGLSSNIVRYGYFLFCVIQNNTYQIDNYSICNIRSVGIYPDVHCKYFVALDLVISSFSYSKCLEVWVIWYVRYNHICIFLNFPAFLTTTTRKPDHGGPPLQSPGCHTVWPLWDPCPP